MAEQVTPGQLVFSRAGRDRGRPFLVYGLVDDTHVLLVDGERRPLERPKLKNIRHLTVHAAVDPLFARGQYVRGAKGVTNEAVRQAIRQLLADEVSKESPVAHAER